MEFRFVSVCGRFRRFRGFPGFVAGSQLSLFVWFRRRLFQDETVNPDQFDTSQGSAVEVVMRVLSANDIL